MSSCVLDASAVIAYLHDEPGAGLVAAALEGAAISAVNLSEVVSKLLERGTSEDQARRATQDLHIAVVPFDEHLAYLAATLRPATRAQGLSFGDRACLATARRLAAPALTADRRWARLRVGVQVQVIR